MAECIGFVAVPLKDKTVFPRAFIRSSAAFMHCKVASLESEIDGPAVNDQGKRHIVYFTITGTDANIKLFKSAVKDVYSEYSVQIS